MPLGSRFCARAAVRKNLLRTAAIFSPLQGAGKVVLRPRPDCFFCGRVV